ncbi:MAG: BrnT family toxin [Gemmatimonadales bacterium]
MASFPDDLASCTGFQWDEGNAAKNWTLHQVSQAEAEQVYFNRPVLVAPDLRHSAQEPRYGVLGQTDGGRRLSIVFALRETLVRVISARDMSRPERRIYEQAQAE